jgi:hypothetical protein
MPYPKLSIGIVVMLRHATLKMEATYFRESLLPTYQTSRCLNMNLHHRENLN